MRKVICLLGLILSCSFVAKAQDSKVDIFVGPNYYRFISGNFGNGGTVNGPVNPINAYGFTASAAYNLRSWAAIEAELGYENVGSLAQTTFNGKISGWTMDYAVGPKITPFQTKSIDFFGHVLFGGVHPGGDLATHSTGPLAPGTAFTDSFDMVAGVGFDWKASRMIAVRLAQADYVMTRFGYQNGLSGFENQTNIRFSAGVVIRLGQK